MAKEDPLPADARHMFNTLRQIQGGKHIAGLGVLSAVIAGTVLVSSLVARTAALTQLPIAPSTETAYRGAGACVECHPAEYEAWVGTKHALASAEAPFREDWAAHGGGPVVPGVSYDRL